VYSLEDTVLSSWQNYIHLTSFKVIKVSKIVIGNQISFQVIVLPLILDTHVCAYDTYIYRVSLGLHVCLLIQKVSF